MTCSKCGGDMLGDGYTVVKHCEYAEEDDYKYREPDAWPVECDFEDQDDEVRARVAAYD